MFSKRMQQFKVAVLLRNHTGAVNQMASWNLFFLHRQVYGEALHH